jgi:hypothetical protein
LVDLFDEKKREVEELNSKLSKANKALKKEKKHRGEVTISISSPIIRFSVLILYHGYIAII